MKQHDEQGRVREVAQGDTVSEGVREMTRSGTVSRGAGPRNDPKRHDEQGGMDPRSVPRRHGEQGWVRKAARSGRPAKQHDKQGRTQQRRDIFENGTANNFRRVS